MITAALVSYSEISPWALGRRVSSPEKRWGNSGFISPTGHYLRSGSIAKSRELRVFSRISAELVTNSLMVGLCGGGCSQVRTALRSNPCKQGKIQGILLKFTPFGRTYCV